MPEAAGSRPAGRSRTSAPSAKIIMLTMSDEEEDLFDAIKAGASGYLLKDIPLDEVAEAVSVGARRAVADQPVDGGQAAHRVRLAGQQGRRGAAQQVPAPKLTDREMQVLKLVARGMNNRDIAKELFISENTVKNHVRNILEKLQISLPDGGGDGRRAREADRAQLTAVPTPPTAHSRITGTSHRGGSGLRGRSGASGYPGSTTKPGSTPQVFRWGRVRLRGHAATITRGRDGCSRPPDWAPQTRATVNRAASGWP